MPGISYLFYCFLCFVPICLFSIPGKVPYVMCSVLKSNSSSESFQKRDLHDLSLPIVPKRWTGNLTLVYQGKSKSIIF
jgi:hypothetical protein